MDAMVRSRVEALQRRIQHGDSMAVVEAQEFIDLVCHRIADGVRSPMDELCAHGCGDLARALLLLYGEIGWIEAGLSAHAIVSGYRSNGGREVALEQGAVRIRLRHEALTERVWGSVMASSPDDSTERSSPECTDLSERFRKARRVTRIIDENRTPPGGIALPHRDRDGR